MANQEPRRNSDPAMWRVVADLPAEASLDDAMTGSVLLMPGTRLRHAQSAWNLQRCDRFEVIFSMERFHVLDGPHAGHCVEVLVTNATPDKLALPPSLETTP